MKTPVSLLNFVGNTPLVKAQGIIDKPGIELYFKMEGHNPGGSVKDRPAYNMISQALSRGDIKVGSELVEATSGNTGIALAYVANLLGVKMNLVMPENSTEERIKTMRAYGANLILTDADKGIEGARDVALDLQQSKGYVILNQFENDDNWKAHYKTTGPEIWNATHGKITHFVSAMGTTGTIMGVSTYLKEQNPNITIVGAQPKDGARIPGIRKWSPDYVPKIFNPKKVDRIIEITENDAQETTRKLAKLEGIFAGMSSGGSAFSALQIANEIKEGVIVAIICDRGDRYLSSNLF
ncbi:MAG: cysteine synthase CysM [Winogradskyella sp.]|uniref:cysteine synthase CysM n=1 Tax=Winogradskyella sp. TaxID=1883156 RepID=UPI000F3BAB64|nr:cysteine synthase CysM [Winogradskyella sp.]RNC84194.1 MAG: cysteine synthase CysM [Winogradskyella sp.]